MRRNFEGLRLLALRKRPNITLTYLSHFSHISLTFFLISKKFVSLHPNSNPKNVIVMAKIYGLFGSMTGKLADTVMTVRYGEQLVRKHQPVVYNPNTEGQVAQRAKMKMMSQLSAVMAPVIAIRREGSVSSRNLFVKYNFKSASFTDGVANIQLADIKLTKSVVSLPRLTASLAGSDLTVALSSAVTDINRVVYCVFRKEADNTIRLVASQVVTTPGTVATFSTTFAVFTDPHIVYAYGVRDNTEAARVVFGDLQAPSAETVAKLVTSTTLLDTDITLTETQYIAPTQA